MASQRAQADEAEREIAQARLVTAEIQYSDGYENDRYRAKHGVDFPDIVQITNHSDSIILHPRIEGFVHQNGGTVHWDILTELPEGDYEDGAPTLLRSAASDRVTVSIRYDPPITEDMWPMRTQPIIGFTDAHGRRWRRTGSASPIRLSKDDAFPITGPSWYRANHTGP